MKPPRDRTVVHVRDLSEQRERPLILVVGGPHRNYISVDKVVFEDGAVKGLIYDTVEHVYTPVAICPLHGSWGVIHRDLLEIKTLASSLQDQVAETIGMQTLATEMGIVVEAPEESDQHEYIGAGKHTYL